MSRRTRTVAAAVLALAVAAAAQDKGGKPAEPKSADEKLAATIKRVINRGADLYNEGDRAAAYRLFEGALLAIEPQLEGRPEMQKSIAKGLAAADRDPVVWRRAFTLRDVLDKLRTDLSPKAKEKQKPRPMIDEDEKFPPAKKEKEKDKDKDKDKKKEEKKGKGPEDEDLLAE